MSNLIKTILFVFLTQISFCQTKSQYPSVIIANNDTLVCFTTKQSKQMAVWNEQMKECIELRKNDSNKTNELINISTTQTGIISNLEDEIILHIQTSKDKDALLNICEDEKKSLKKEIRKQKLGKWIAIISGVFLSGVMLMI
jgi:hypothetical protein